MELSYRTKPLKPTDHPRRRLALTSVLLTLVLVSLWAGAVRDAAASAQAPSSTLVPRDRLTVAAGVGRIVYIKGANVWTANPDGSVARMLTRNGTQALPYREPTIADNGTVVAVRGHGSRAALYRFRSDGRFLGSIQTDSLLSGPLDPQISPDGKLVAYWSVHVLRPCLWCYLKYPFQHHYTYADRFTPSGVFGKEMSQRAPSWVGNARTIAFYGMKAYYDDLGRGPNSAIEWFSDADVVADPTQWRQFIEGELTRAGDKLAVLRRLDGARDQITIFQANGGPSAKPTAVCHLLGGRLSTQTGLLDNPAWSPDGRFLTFADPSGIWIASVPDVGAGCGPIRVRLAIPGGTQPDW